MLIRTDISARGPGQLASGRPGDAGTSAPNGSHQELDRQLTRARQALTRGGLSPADAAKLRSFLTLADRALSRGDLNAAQRYADDAEQASGMAPGSPGPESLPSGPAEPTGGRDEGAGPPERGPADAGDLGQAQRRTYHDVSSDPGVSFKQPTPLTEGQAEVMVRFHERQHIRRDTQAAAAEGRKVVQAYTTVSYRTDPATGRRYIKGGKAIVRTVSKPPSEFDTLA